MLDSTAVSATAAAALAEAVNVPANGATDAPNPPATDAPNLPEKPANPYPNVKRALDSLARAIATSAETALSAVDSEYAAQLDVLRNMPDSLIIRTAIAGYETECEQKRRDVGLAILSDIRAAYATEFSVLAPAPKAIDRPTLVQQTAGKSATTGEESIQTSADGHEYLKKVISRVNFDETAADSCGKIGCRFCTIAAQAGTVKSYGAYRMMLSKAIPLMTSDEITARDGCMYGLALAGLNAYTQAAVCTLYVPSGR